MRPLLILLPLVASCVLLIWFKGLGPAELIYFTNPGCQPAHAVDKLISELNQTFGDELRLRWVNVSMYEGDPQDPEWVKELRERYDVHGVPTIVLNQKPFRDKYTKENLLRGICTTPRIFLSKPIFCIGWILKG
jgi:thiol-disulfide isomerase/thioredoxin